MYFAYVIQTPTPRAPFTTYFSYQHSFLVFFHQENEDEKLPYPFSSILRAEGGFIPFSDKNENMPTINHAKAIIFIRYFGE